MRALEILTEYYDPSGDQQGIAHLDDTRRPRLTFMHLQKLRKARDMEKYENAEHIKFLPDMYGVSAQPDQGMM